MDRGDAIPRKCGNQNFEIFRQLQLLVILKAFDVKYSRNPLALNYRPISGWPRTVTRTNTMKIVDGRLSKMSSAIYSWWYSPPG